MGYASWQQFFADAIVLTAICGIVLCSRNGLRNFGGLVVTSVVSGVLLTMVVFAVGYWYGPRGDPKRQAWFVERTRQYDAGTGTTGMREVDTDIVLVRGPFDRESACIATLEDPTTGSRRDDGLTCERDDFDSRVVADPGP